ncbi:WV assembly protein [Brazilian porcupinepox virus 1]|nr:WV assembly protein [Brazilian porcupinepox virus 1]
MLPVSSLHELLFSDDNDEYNIYKIYKKLKKDDAIRLILSGLHPKRLPKKWYSEIVSFIPNKLYLFKPKDVAFIDLISIIKSNKNLDLYTNHIIFFKNEIIKICDKDIIIKCISYFDIYDDDIRILTYRFQSIDDIIININYTSIPCLNYIFNEDITEKMLMRDYRYYKTLYSNQIYTRDFLLDMLYKYGITPINEGILYNITIEIIIEILSSIRSSDDSVAFLDMLKESQLTDDRLQDYIIKNINMGEIEKYKTYASEYLYCKRDQLGVYENIFFNEYLDIKRYKITKEQIKNVCMYIDNYYLDMLYIVDYIIKKEYFDILASILDKIPKEILSEEICIRVICESGKKVQLKYLPIHSSLIMVLCIQMKYDDIVELLDTIELDTLIEKDVDIITDYVLETDWYNKDNRLLDLFVKKYGFCVYKLNKLLFEYPLDKKSTKYLLNIINNNNYSKLFYNISSTLFYLVSTSDKLKIEKIDNISNIIFSSKKVNGLIISNRYKVRSIILYSNIPYIDKSYFNNITYFKSISGISVIINKDIINKILVSEYEILTELYNIGILARYGLFYIPYKYFPSWIPIKNIINGEKYTLPSKIEHGVILKTYPTDFIEYKSLGRYISNIYYLEEHITNFQGAINSIIQTLLLYIAIGSKYSTSETKDFIISLVNSFLKGMKINEIIYDDITNVCTEINTFKQYIRDGGFVIIKKKYLNKTLEFCENICSRIILYNNKY